MTNETKGRVAPPWRATVVAGAAQLQTPGDQSPRPVRDQFTGHDQAQLPLIGSPSLARCVGAYRHTSAILPVKRVPPI
ncbi:hypothetical protein HDF16_002828 [Granulicella aggregans]|uniref:Uncharacterized protein n=1 Tax=Granulicella aggregans TaxID=474949 RepID=A0A7W7ZE56_9BACT|nr:hypothetical protein [Granulicella aggregans]